MKSDFFGVICSNPIIPFLSETKENYLSKSFNVMKLKQKNYTHERGQFVHGSQAIIVIGQLHSFKTT